jgi:hypothetical protein
MYFGLIIYNLYTTAKNRINKFEFHPLLFAYDALEPSIDKLTLDIHFKNITSNYKHLGEVL